MSVKLQPFGATESETILQELENYSVTELESINKGLNKKMINKMLGLQKKNRIGKYKADQIYERFMDYDKKIKRNMVTRKIQNIDKENQRVRRSTSKSRLMDGMSHKAKFLERVDHMIESRQKKLAELQIEKVIQDERELLKECTFQPDISRDDVYQ